MRNCKIIFISCIFFLLIGIAPTHADNVPEGTDWKYALKPYHVAKKDFAPWLNFYDGIAVVKVDGYYGGINQEVKIVIPNFTV